MMWVAAMAALISADMTEVVLMGMAASIVAGKVVLPHVGVARTLMVEVDVVLTMVVVGLAVARDRKLVDAQT